MIFNFQIIETKGQLPDGKYRYVKVQFGVKDIGPYLAASPQIVSIGATKGIELGLVKDFINDPLEVAKSLNLTASVSSRYMYFEQVYKNAYEFENGYVTKIVITPNKRNVTYYFENNGVSDFYPHKYCRYQRSTETFAFISSRNKIVRLWVDRPWIDLMVDGKIQFGGNNLPDSFCVAPPRKDIKFDHPFPLRDCYVTIAGVDYLPRKHNLTADDIAVVRFETMITKKDSK